MTSNARIFRAGPRPAIIGNDLLHSDLSAVARGVLVTALLLEENADVDEGVLAQYLPARDGRQIHEAVEELAEEGYLLRDGDVWTFADHPMDADGLSL